MVRNLFVNPVDRGIMTIRKGRVCPVERAGGLDNRIRRWLQNPAKILGDLVREGMSVLDFGCGPGHFTLDMARMVGPSGRVFAVDLQEGMLAKLRQKIRLTELEQRITLRKCGTDSIGISEKVDFVLAFYVLHELVDQQQFFQELSMHLEMHGRVLVVEPPLHVSKADFAGSLAIARDLGFTVLDGPPVIFSKSAVLYKD